MSFEQKTQIDIISRLFMMHWSIWWLFVRDLGLHLDGYVVLVLCFGSLHC